MGILAEIMERHPDTKRLTNDEYEARRAEWANSIVGNLDGYDCTDCLNRGYITKLADNGSLLTADCSCMATRRSLKLIEKSGLKPLMERYTFEAYSTDASWQEDIKKKALEFAAESKGWFGVLGQTGSGKTHICTAIAANLLKSGMSTYYMLWNTDIKKLKATINDGESHEKEIERLQTVKVLYIDDLFKCKTEPSDSDVKLAFEILNARYNAELITLISSEYCIDRISEIDQAIAGRINEMGGRYVINIAHNPERDYRWRGVAV